MLAPLAGRIYDHAPAAERVSVNNATSLLIKQPVISPEHPKLSRVQVTGLLATGGAITGAIALSVIVGFEMVLFDANPFCNLTTFGLPALLGAAFGALAAPLGG